MSTPPLQKLYARLYCQNNVSNGGPFPPVAYVICERCTNLCYLLPVARMPRFVGCHARAFTALWYTIVSVSEELKLFDRNTCMSHFIICYFSCLNFRVNSSLDEDHIQTLITNQIINKPELYCRCSPPRDSPLPCPTPTHR